MTGVIAANYREFRIWAKERRIFVVNKSTGLHADIFGESYTPITRLAQIGGRRFKDYEIVTGLSIHPDRDELEAELRKRIF